MESPAVDQLLESAQVWALGRDGRTPELLAGWEDGDQFCATVCATDAGLAICRGCPAALVARVTATRRTAGTRCPSGVRLLAFPVLEDQRSHGVWERVAVLRVAPPSVRAAAGIAARAGIDPATLRRAARLAPRHDWRTALAAARRLRRPEALHDWQVAQRERAAAARRTATVALAQVTVTSREFLALYRSSERQRAELLRRERQVARLARAVVRARDEERLRLAHELHDTAAQSLVSAYRFLEAARTSVATTVALRPAAPDADATVMTGRHAVGVAVSERHLASASEMLLTAIGEVRAVLGDLLPPGLEQLGLGAAVRDRLERAVQGTAITAIVTGELPRLPAWVEQALYTMTLEAISNAVRHAHPDTIWIELGQRRGRAVVIIGDDGIGFDTTATSRRATHGLGLVGLGHQAGWLGGRTTVRSAAGRGTQVRISVPIDPARGRGRRTGARRAVTDDALAASSTGA